MEYPEPVGIVADLTAIWPGFACLHRRGVRMKWVKSQYPRIPGDRLEDYRPDKGDLDLGTCPLHSFQIHGGQEHPPGYVRQCHMVCWRWGCWTNLRRVRLMRLANALVHAVLFLMGAAIGWLAERWFPLPSGYLPLCVGLVFTLGLAWPLYRLLGLMPPPPPCPKCSAKAYERLQEGGKQNHWRCSTCGQVIAMSSGTSAVALAADGTPGREQHLRWPKIFGRWK